MDGITLVKTALEYHDKNTEINNNIFKHVEYYKVINIENNTENDIIIFFDKDKKELFRSTYEILSMYTTLTNTWIWSWALPMLAKKKTNISRKIFLYGSSLEVSNNKNIFLKSELITSRFRLTHQIQSDIHISISSYLSKIPMIYKLDLLDTYDEKEDCIKINKNKSNETYYLFLLDYSDIIKKFKSDIDDVSSCNEE